MFNIGDLIIYSAHGVCKIYDIKEKIFLGERKNYYEIHPINDERLFLSVPVDKGDLLLFKMSDKDEAKTLLDTFKGEGYEWIENNNERSKIYSDILKAGNREEISKVLNALVSESRKLNVIDKKLNEKDKRILISIEEILFSDLAYALSITHEEVKERIYKSIKSRMK